MSRRKAPTVTLATTMQQIIVIGEVVDPYETNKKAKAAVNVREHALAYLRHLERLSDEQFLAGNEFRKNYEAAVLGGFKAIDYSRVRVDGGQLSDPLTERAQAAHKWLNEVARLPGIGPVGYSLLSRIAGEGESIGHVAKTWPGESRMSSQRMEGFISGRLTECLDLLVDHLGLVARGKAKRA